MSGLQWIPLIATLALIYLLRWLHIGVTDFKLFVLIIMVWSLLLILFYRHTRRGSAEGLEPGAAPEAELSTED